MRTSNAKSLVKIIRKIIREANDEQSVGLSTTTDADIEAMKAIRRLLKLEVQ